MGAPVYNTNFVGNGTRTPKRTLDCKLGGIDVVPLKGLDERRLELLLHLRRQRHLRGGGVRGGCGRRAAGCAPAFRASPALNVLPSFYGLPF